ncbi:MAG: hypothetical protein MJ188_05870 [Treponema sp.]|nr:hypothetical protein [Treponema sp.]
MKKLFAELTFLFLGIKLFAGVMEVPRKVFVLSTTYFDFLFSAESAQTALLLGEEADDFYLEAKEAFGNSYDFKTLVVISPDSERLLVHYSPSPYNRILVFEGRKGSEQESYKNGLRSLFRYEVSRAVSQSVRSDLWEKISEHVGGDSLQPVALMNMPFSFLEGAVSAELADEEAGLLNDPWNLQLLAQMKIENVVPSLAQLFGAMDVFPGQQFAKVAGSAFCAYIQQRWGLEQFRKLWLACGEISFFKVTKSIFFQVYGYSLEQAWLDFIDSIPLPEDLVNEEIGEGALFFDSDGDCLYKFLVHTPYGFVWYDDSKKEVDIYDTFSPLKMKSLLFLASDVENLSVTPDGRFLIVTNVQGGSRRDFKRYFTRVFDLKERRFVKNYFEQGAEKFLPVLYGGDENFSAEDGNFEEKVISGEEARENFLEKENSGKKEVSEKYELDASGALVKKNSIPKEFSIYAPVKVGENGAAVLLCRENRWLVGIYSGDKGKIGGRFYQIKYGNEILGLKNLRVVDLVANSALGIQKALFFDFVLKDKPAFSRFGFILLDGENVPQGVFVLSQDFSGGMNDAILVKDKIFYFSHKFNHWDFCSVPFSKLEFEKGELWEINNLWDGEFGVAGTESGRRDFAGTEYAGTEYADTEYADTEYADTEYAGTKNAVTKNTSTGLSNQGSVEAEKIYSMVYSDGSTNYFLADKMLAQYKPLSFLFNGGSWTPFMPVRNIDIINGVEKQLGVGLTFQTQADPLLINHLLLSAGALFIPMEFTKLFNGTKDSQEKLAATKLDLEKDFAFTAYYTNSSFPFDISLGGISKFNFDGEYTLKAVGGTNFEFPFLMDFRRLTMDIKGLFMSSTSYWDPHQVSNYPDLSNWPSIHNSYRSWQVAFALQYTNIHQYGLSPLKKMGIEAGMLLSSTWDVNLIELQIKSKNALSKTPQTKTEKNHAIENQRWNYTYSPTQINAGLFTKLELPFLAPLQNRNGWIFCFPTTISGELFYTNGTAIDVDFKILLLGKEIQKGIEKINVYFPRFGLYGGYDVALIYDTQTVALPDLRDFTRFYEACSSCTLNDSIYINLCLFTTPVVGKFSVNQLISNIILQYYMRTQECKLTCNFELKL